MDCVCVAVLVALTTAWIKDVNVQIHGTVKPLKGSASIKMWIDAIIKIYQQINPFTKSHELFGFDELKVDRPCLNAPDVISWNLDALDGLFPGLAVGLFVMSYLFRSSQFVSFVADRFLLRGEKQQNRNNYRGRWMGVPRPKSE